LYEFLRRFIHPLAPATTSMLINSVVFLSTISAISGTASILACRGSFSVRQSVCDHIPATMSDVVPSEHFACSAPLSPGDFASVLKNTPNKPDLPKLDFASGARLAYSASQMTAPTVATVSYGDCASPSKLPWLEDESQYIALIVLDKQSILDSNSTSSSATSVVTQATVRYYDVEGLANAQFRVSLADQLMACHTSNGHCQLGFNTQVVTKDAFVEVPNNV
jgi:hypothetical protein